MCFSLIFKYRVMLVQVIVESTSFCTYFCTSDITLSKSNCMNSIIFSDYFLRLLVTPGIMLFLSMCFFFYFQVRWNPRHSIHIFVSVSVHIIL